MHPIEKSHFLMDLIFGEKSRLIGDEEEKEQKIGNFLEIRFASHWKHQNRSYRTLTKAFGLRFIISVSE